MKIKYDIDLMGIMGLFEKITHAKLKDCFVDEKNDILVFIVQPGQIGKALGKKAMNVKKLNNSFKRKLKIVEFHPQMLEFIRNMVMPLKVEAISEEEDVVTIKGGDVQTKGLLIGRNAQNLRNLEENVKRYFPELKEIKVV